MSKHTEGPWRWEISMQSKVLHLVGGRPQYDLTIIDFDRWGMSRATMSLRDTAVDGMNLMHKLHERPDWIEPFPGREHHKSWCQNVIHPDARLIAAAPTLLAALKGAEEALSRCEFAGQGGGAVAASLTNIRAAVRHATGEQQ